MSLNTEPRPVSDLKVLAAEHPQYFAELVRNRRWNYTANMVDIGTFAITGAALAETTVLPYFVSQLTPNVLVVSLSPALAWLGMYVPQLAGAYLAHSHRLRKPLMVRLAWVQRLVILVMATVALGIGRLPATVMLTSFLAAYFVFWCITGLLAPTYSDFYAKHIPFGRGLFLGMQTVLYAGMGIVGAEIVRQRLLAADFPQNMHSILFIAFFAALPALAAFHHLREVQFPVPAIKQRWESYVSEIPALLRAHPAFVRFLVVRGVGALSKLAVPLLAIFALQRFQLGGEMVAVYTAVMLIAQSLSALGWGVINDRMHYHWAWLADAVVVVAYAFLATWAPSAEWFIVIFALVGISLGAELTSQPNTIYSISPPAETARFVGIANTLFGLVLTLSPVIGGLLAKQFSFETALLAGLIAAAAGLVVVVIWIISERRLPHERFIL